MTTEFDWAKKLPWDLIRAEAAGAGLDPYLVAAIAQHESGGNAFASRFEAAWRYFVDPSGFAVKTGVTVATELNQQATSWGFMQPMGSVLRELGFTGLFPQICDPALNFKFGCEKLRRLSIKYSNELELISAYNAGHAERAPSGQFVNQRTYVAPVCALLSELRGIS